MSDELPEDTTDEVAERGVFSILPEGYQGVSYAVAAEAFTPDGRLVLVTRFSSDMTSWKATGMAAALSEDTVTLDGVLNLEDDE